MANIEVKNILPQISGRNIENRLTDLAAIGGQKISGTLEQPLRYAVYRLALSSEDIEARKHLEEKMIQAGMSVTQEPLATIGVYQGTNPEAKPLLIISHHDSVPNGGMYDGVVGVNAGIEIIDIFNRNKIRFPHPIILISFTEEESSRFSTGLGGSKGITQGLNESELDRSDKNDITKRMALENLGFDPQQVKIPHPLFDRFNAALASIELHVEQNSRLAQQNTEIGIINAIAAPLRYKINIETPKTSFPEQTKNKNAVYLDIGIIGKTGHSGATPMGKSNRADALVSQAEMLIHLNSLQNTLKKEGNNTQISIGDLSLNPDASINKIPGSSHMNLKISGTNTLRVAALVQNIKEFIDQRNQKLTKTSNSFSKEPITLTVTTESNDKFYDNLPYFSAAAYIIKSIQSIANIHRKENTVGTVGTFQFKNGEIQMEIDLRGINKTDRDEAASKIDKIRQILTQSPVVTNNQPITCNKEEIAKSDPTLMNPDLVKMAEKVITENNIGSHTITFSPAGHDTQNIARVGIPTVMFFIPSRNGGAAHNPDEYSTPKDLENGTKALLALVYELASLPTNDIPNYLN